MADDKMEEARRKAEEIGGRTPPSTWRDVGMSTWLVALAAIALLIGGAVIGWLVCNGGKQASVNAVKKEAAEACKADVKSAVDACEADSKKALTACNADKAKTETALAECQKNCQKPTPTAKKKRPPKKARAAVRPVIPATAAPSRYAPAPVVTCGGPFSPGPCPPTSQVLTGQQRFRTAIPCPECE